MTHPRHSDNDDDDDGGDHSYDGDNFMMSNNSPRTPQTPDTPEPINPAASPLNSSASAAVPSISSPFRKNRYENRTRRECLEKKKWHQRQSPSHQLQPRKATSPSPGEVVEEYESFRQGQSPQFLSPPPPPPTRQQQDEEKKSDSGDNMIGTTTTTTITNSLRKEYADLIRKPQHHQQQYLNETPSSSLSKSISYDNDVKFYRVAYRGVVALLSEPDQGAPRSGCYLSYGEVIKSRCQIIVPNDDHGGGGGGGDGTTSTTTTTAIRVDDILTGGYAYDPTSKNPYHHQPNRQQASPCHHSKTPKRSNVAPGYTTTTTTTTTATTAADSPVTPPVTIALSQSASSSSSSSEKQQQQQQQPLELLMSSVAQTPRCETNDGIIHQGYVFLQNKKGASIVEPLQQPPMCQHGRFFYKIVSTTPLPILLGPSSNSPLSKAMVLPGTVHEVSFRINFLIPNNDASNDGNDDGDNHQHEDGIWFLRLAKRKGYIASQRVGRGLAGANAGRIRRRPRSSEPLVKDITDEINSNNLQVCGGSGSMCEDDNSNATNVSVLSALSTTIPSSTARHPRRRHRPPRRIRDVGPPRPVRHNLHNKHQQHHNHNDASALVQNLSVQSHSSDRLQTPSSNVSLLSDDSGLMDHNSNSNGNNTSLERGALSPDRSVARSNHSFQQSQTPQHPTFFLMRVTAPRGLRILDAPHFQVNNLIHGTNGGNHHQTTDLFHTTRLATTNPAENSVVFDSISKTRILRRGAVFEASKRMETADALFHQGAGLIKLADNSGWVIVPHSEELENQFRSNGQQFESSCRGYEEIGNAIVFGESSKSTSSSCWMRVVARGGVHVVCSPPSPPPMEDNSSPSSSPASSAVVDPNQQLALAKSDSASDVASSVGSSFLDAMFRGPKRSDASDDKKAAVRVDKPTPPSTIISCGICVRVEPQIPPDHHQHRKGPQEYTRLRGGQGWMPLFMGGKPACVVCPRRNPPESRFGSYWFRVQSKRGIKVRLGPSKRAPSIKSGDGVYFRFECGEFLRASEVMTVYHEDSQGRTLTESFAKLYRNRHVRLHAAAKGGSDYRDLASFTTQSEWVQIHDDERNELFLHEFDAKGAPRIERHKQGWRYKVIASEGVSIKKGPSFDAEDSDMFIAEGESVAIIERVTCPTENGVTWLRLKEGQGWLYDLERGTGEKLIIPHSFRHRTKATNTRPSKPNRPQSAGDDKNQKIAYNTIIARLFHNDLPSDHMPSSPSCQAENMGE